MFRGIILALVLFAVADLCFNDSRMTHATLGKITGWAAASSESVNSSIFRR